MGDYPTKQSELIRDNLSHTNIGLSEPCDGLNYGDAYTCYRFDSEVSSRFSLTDGSNGVNISKNGNKEVLMKHTDGMAANDFNSENLSQFVGNNGNIDVNSRQARFQQPPYILTVLPQMGMNQKLNKTGVSQMSSTNVTTPPGFYNQVPFNGPTTEPSVYYPTQRGQYIRPVQPMRNIEFSWYAGKVAPNNYSPIYQQERGVTRTGFGPIGAEVAGLRCGVVRNFPTQVNMVRIFPENRIQMNNIDNNDSYVMSQKNFIAKTEDNFIDTDKADKKNENSLINTSVHLGGLLTIPRGVDNPLDSSSSQSSSNASDNSNFKAINNIALFKDTATQGCNEIQNLIKQYNIKSPTINIDNFCKSVQRQMNNSKNIMQMEPIMREMILGYLYLSNSWSSLASVLAVQREHTPPLDNSLEALKAEFVSWQRKSKIMLEQIIVSLKKIPQEHEKYIAGTYKSSCSSSENSTLLTDESFSDSENDAKDKLLKRNYMHNDKDYDAIMKCTLNNFELNDTNCKTTANKDSAFDNVAELNYNYRNDHQNRCQDKLQEQDDTYLQRTLLNNKEKLTRTRQISLVDSSSYAHAQRKYSPLSYNSNTNGLSNFTGNGKKNYSSNRPPLRNKFNPTPVSPRNLNRK